MIFRHNDHIKNGKTNGKLVMSGVYKPAERYGRSHQQHQDRSELKACRGASASLKKFSILPARRRIENERVLASREVLHFSRF